MLEQIRRAIPYDKSPCINKNRMSDSYQLSVGLGAPALKHSERIFMQANSHSNLPHTSSPPVMITSSLDNATLRRFLLSLAATVHSNADRARGHRQHASG